MEITAQIEKLKHLQEEIDAIRSNLGISAPGTIIYQTDNENLLLVEADGFGAATLRLIKGNYPIDYNVLYEKLFTSEQEAISMAGVMNTSCVSCL